LGFRFKPWIVYTEAIRSEISRKLKGGVDFHDQALLNIRVDRDPSEDPLAEYLRASYAKRAPDLIITNAVAAAAFVGRHRERLFPGVPMLLTGLATRRAQRLKLTENDTSTFCQFVPDCASSAIRISASGLNSPSGNFSR
jgi:hypothetical protein